MGSPAPAGDVGLLRVAYGSKDNGTALLRKLNKQLADATCPRMNETTISRFEGEGRTGEVVGSTTLEHQRGRRGKRNLYWHRHDSPRRYASVLGIAAAREAVGDWLAYREVCDTFTDRLHRAGAFHSQRQWQLAGIRGRLRVCPVAHVDVDEIDSRPTEFDGDLAGCGQRHFYLCYLQALRTAKGFDDNRFHRTRIDIS